MTLAVAGVGVLVGKGNVRKWSVEPQKGFLVFHKFGQLSTFHVDLSTGQPLKYNAVCYAITIVLSSSSTIVVHLELTC